MGNYVDTWTQPFDWGGEKLPVSGAFTRDLVEQKYTETMATAEDMYDRLKTYLENLNSIITSYSAPDVGDFTVTVPTISVTPDNRPTPTIGTLDTDFPTFDVSSPSLSALPTVDLSALTPAVIPDAVSPTISWSESAHSSETFNELVARLEQDLQTAVAVLTFVEIAHDETLYNLLLARVTADLTDGATGLATAVEEAIFARQAARFAVEEDKIQSEIEEYFSSTGFELPSGAYAARLAEHANARAMRLLDLNQKVTIDQAELAQKNSQFIISTAKEIEAILRDFTNQKNNRALDYAKASADVTQKNGQFAISAATQLEGALLDFTGNKNVRALDYAKSVAANEIAVYAESVKAYLAAAEANKSYVEVQVENLKAVVESNKGLVASYAAEAEAYKVNTEAKAKRNEAVTEIYKAEITGYDAETRAVTANQNVTIEEYRLRLQNADMQLRTAIAEVDAALRAYGTESSLREKVVADMANIAMQMVASCYGAVNMSAGVSHQTGQQQSESFGHTENRSMGYDHNQSITETHSYEDE